MISVIQAQELIRQHIVPLAPEPTELVWAHRRVLREAVVSPEDMPPFDRSAMDGYAVLEADLADEFEVVAEIRAGQVIERKLAPGQAVRIFTGAQLPGPGLKVIMQEHVDASAGRIRVVKRIPASHVRHRGEDARAGEVLLGPGTLLDASAIALLASLGKTSPLVSRQVKVLHLTTGDEIVPPEQTPGPGQIRNSNGALIWNLCRDAGALVTHLHAKDDLPAMIDGLKRAGPERHDLILISGGSGQGTYDFSGDLFKHLDATIHFREVNVRPGKPLIFGSKGAQIIFGLPGNALSHFVCFHLFVRRAIDHLRDLEPVATTQAHLAAELAETSNARETWWPVSASVKEGRLECHALPWKSSGDITRLPGANALMKVPASTSHLRAGTMVDLLATRNLI